MADQVRFLSAFLKETCREGMRRRESVVWVEM